MDTVATLIVLVLLALGVGAIVMGATVGVPGAIKEPPKPRLAPALATTGSLRPGQIQQEAFVREVERAVAARGLTPMASPDDSPGMQLKVLSGVAVSALIILVMGAYAIWEPSREAQAADRQLHENVERGAKLFTTYCARCHGPTGTGLVGPNLHLAAFTQRHQWNPNDPADLQKMRDLVEKTITHGRAGTVMPAWGRDDGGPFNETQISNLADLIMTDGWAAVVPAPGGVAAAPAAETPTAGGAAASGTPAAGGAAAAPGAAGQALIAKYGCGACHTIPGIAGAVGTIGPNLDHVASRPKIPSSTGTLDNTPDNLKKWIFNAPSVKPGTQMPNFSAAGMTEDDAAKIVEFLETLK